ncbi:hypothetical protein [Azospirillum sp.]|uniref:hypothetical protein n=1 Tax=Azospirillum sp. TaxID=34012 RepID=UPI002D4782A0|nr:hypothetical protein [Azospirillum sp.]HYD67953.1 hypothetical protein [Azospirillum sp.]
MKGGRHLEVRLGNVETSAGARHVFAAVAKAETDITLLIQHSLAVVGQSEAAEVSAFTDGCSGLRSLLAAAGVTTQPYLDWFHIAMRLQHAKQMADALLTDTAVALADLERQGQRRAQDAGLPSVVDGFA